MRDRKGFTLIELLIVVVIIGILAAIAIPKFSATRERAFQSTLRSDLKNLATQQEIWYANPANNYTYAAQAEIGTLPFGFSPSNNVTITMVGGTANGWSATATHSGLPTTFVCALFIGDVTAVAPATMPGQLRCTGDPT